MRTSFVLAFLLALGAMLSPARATAAEEDAPYFLKRPRVRRWKLGHWGELRPTFVGDALSITHGVELSYELRRHLRVGGSVVLPIAAAPGHCYQYGLTAGDCSYNSFGLLGFAELHRGTDVTLDPWIRAGMGNLVHVSREGVFRGSDRVVPDIQVFASAGLDINAGPVYFGAYGTVAAFVGAQANLGGGGVHLGARF